MLDVPHADLIGPCVFLPLCCGECHFGCLQFVCFPIYVSVFVVCFMIDCVGELCVECVCYLCMVFQRVGVLCL